ncbi:MAG TPA: hypothetical protein EYP10_03710 [Armatimonadetes bacterium]|nr:hypothetical protein [Armatimonadota bacterium]
MQWLELHRMFTWHHIPAMFVYDWHLVNNGLLGYQIVVSIANDIVPEDALTGLQRFATSGGVVIIDNAFAKYDELLRKRERRSLGKNFLTIDTARYRGDARNSNYSNALFKRIAHSIEERCPQARYLHLNVTSPARPFIKEQFRTLEWAQRNLPEDMSGVRSLGQTVRIPAPLGSVAISTPTYHKRVTDYGFTLRVRLGGPNGAIIATKRIAPPIADNAWHEIRIGREDPANTVYYIEAIPDANLPKQTIGWWGRNEDIYPDGSAFVNGEPVPYDREVVLNVKRYIPTSGALESFVLSDGLNFAVVLINVTEHTVRVRGELNANLLPHSPTRYEWHELITGAKLNDGSQFAIDLGEHATAVVYFKCRTDADEVRELINWLKERIRRLRSDGYLTPVMSALYDRAMEHYLMHRYAKAGALLLRTANQLGIRIESVRRNAVSRGGIRIILSLRSVNEDVIDDARVIAEVVPLFGLTGQFKHIGNGKYELRIPANAMPLRYDYTQQRYVPYDGPIELLIHAFSSRGDGGLRLSW